MNTWIFSKSRALDQFCIQTKSQNIYKRSWGVPNWSSEEVALQEVNLRPEGTTKGAAQSPPRLGAGEARPAVRASLSEQQRHKERLLSGTGARGWPCPGWSAAPRSPSWAFSLLIRGLRSSSYLSSVAGGGTPSGVESGSCAQKQIVRGDTRAGEAWAFTGKGTRREKEGWEPEDFSAP